jgi:hypothetical protein
MCCRPHADIGAAIHGLLKFWTNGMNAASDRLVFAKFAASLGVHPS